MTPATRDDTNHPTRHTTMNTPDQNKPATTSPTIGCQGGKCPHPSDCAVHNGEEAGPCDCGYESAISAISSALKKVKLWCRNCERPTVHVFADPDIQCDMCAYAATAIHPPFA